MNCPTLPKQNSASLPFRTNLLFVLLKAFGERGLARFTAYKTKPLHMSLALPTPADTGHWSGKAEGVGFINWQREMDNLHYWWPL